MRDLPKDDLEFLNLQVALWNIISSLGISICPRTTTSVGFFTFFLTSITITSNWFFFQWLLFFKQRNHVITSWALYVTMNNRVTLRCGCWIDGRVYTIPGTPCSCARLWFRFVLRNTRNLIIELSLPPYRTFINISWTLEHGLGKRWCSVWAPEWRQMLERRCSEKWHRWYVCKSWGSVSSRASVCACVNVHVCIRVSLCL